jgi:outer membrane beta-barrel protein
MVRLTTGLIVVSFVLSTFDIAFAQKSKKASPAEPSSQATVPLTTPGADQAGANQASDKLDVSGLEQKYWAAKDTDFSVVQNRLFNKTGRFALTAEYGTYMSEPWSQGPTLSLSGNYYFSERYGAEIAYSTTQSQDTDAANRLRGQGGAPNHNKMKQFYGAAFNWVPFYAKMSVLNSKIIYFDMSFSPGLGIVQYEQQMQEGGAMKTAPALTLDVTQHFFLNNWLALRFELKNRWYQQDVVSYRQPGRTSVSEMNNTSLLMFGVTLYH